MLGLVAAQLKYQEKTSRIAQNPIWVDIGGGTGWNIESMSKHIDVPSFFAAVYLVDFSPSLCEVARKRFARLGWKNVKVVCQDARLFSLNGCKADLVTMSYSLSMLPNFHIFVDSSNSLLGQKGIIGVVDFYVQSKVETTGRNYLGGSIQRHVNWLGRTFWRAWFDLDRVGLEGARRVCTSSMTERRSGSSRLSFQDYLEYRFGTLKSVDGRNYILGNYSGICIPYYIFIGKLVTSTTLMGELERLDAVCTESPYLPPQRHRIDSETSASDSLHSKAYHSAVVNLSAKLPLPSTFYQNQAYRIYYEENLTKHTQFGNEFIYAFTWEDSRIDQRLLKINSNDVILALTSAGDNLLDYLYSCNPRRIHAVDLNPNQSHLLELKVAAYQSLEYSECWKLFGEGKSMDFRNILLHKLSPYLSSQALQYWLNQEAIFTSSRGLYEYGGSGRTTKLVRNLFRITGLTKTVERFCSAKTLNEQRELWPQIRRVLMNKVLHWVVVGSQFLWKAAGVPPEQADMISKDYLEQVSLNPLRVGLRILETGEAMWQYISNTLDPVARDTLISEDNFYYLLTLKGSYTRRCHPNYLTAKAHAKLSKPGAFDGLRIYTDEINEVIARIMPGTLTLAVVMDSMDWFDPAGPAAAVQITALNRALKLKGRVFLRSAGLKPWYIPTFERLGFVGKRVGARMPGTCIDRQVARPNPKETR